MLGELIEYSATSFSFVSIFQALSVSTFRNANVTFFVVTLKLMSITIP